MDCTISKKNRIIPIISLILVIALLLCLICPVKAQAVAGIDDAIFWSILNQTFMSAAGANYVVGSNGIAVSEADPITEAILKDIYTKGELDRKFYDIVGQEVSEFIESIDWDNVFTVASGTSNIIANLPKVAVDTLTLFAKGLISELGATSDTSVDWDYTTPVSETLSFSLSGYNIVNLSNTMISAKSGAYYYYSGCYDNTATVYALYTFVDNGLDTSRIRGIAFSTEPFVGWINYSPNPALSTYSSELTNSGWYVTSVGALNSVDISTCSVTPTGNSNEVFAYFNSSESNPSVDSLTMTLVPESDTEAMVYPETAVTDYPNVESIPYYTDIPYTGTIPDTGVIPYTEAIPYLQEAVQSNTLTASLEATEEGVIEGITDGSVTIPLFNITLPDFQFNFSGIWYYVVQWVNSLGSWLSQMFTIWGILPAPMVYPVWATAVIVIVLGVYKRFFM